MGYIYKVTCKTTNKIYVGKTERTVEERWKEHITTSKLPSHGDYNFPFHRAIRKYGEENFLIEVIEEINDPELLNEKEKYWINYFNSYYDGYNASLGGDGHSKYNYDDIVNYYLQNNYSLSLTCQHFGIYDQVVYAALRSKNIDYKNLKPKVGYKPIKKKILLIEENIVFNKMTDIDRYFGKVVHPNVRRCLKGICKKAEGYTWKEIEDDLF